MKVLPWLLTAYLSAHFSLLNAHVPNWALDNTSSGWNSEMLAKMYFHYSETQRQWAFELLGKQRFQGNEKILDFGCGDGKITAALSRFVPDGSILGVDLSPEMLRIAHLKFPRYAYPNLEFKRSDSLVFADHSEISSQYDVICSFAVFHLVADPLETLKNLRRSLKSSGRLLLVIPTGTNPTIYQAANDTFVKYGIDPPWAVAKGNAGQTMRTLEGCATFLEEAGYHIVSLDLIETDNAFYSRDEFITWLVGTVTANWNIPLSLSRPFFTDLVERMHELDANLVDQEGRVRFKMPRIHAVAYPRIS